MKNLVKSTLALVVMLLFIPALKATENSSALLEFVTESEVYVGDTINVQMNVKEVMNTDDGVVSLGGYLTFDNTKLEYLGSTLGNAPYLFQMNEEYFIIAGLDFTLENGIKDFTNIYTFTFKVIDEGNTSITLNDARLTDTNDYIKTKVIPANIDITKKQEKNEEKVVDKIVKKISVKSEKVIDLNNDEVEVVNNYEDITFDVKNSVDIIIKDLSKVISIVFK